MTSTATLIWAEFGRNCDLYGVLGVEKNATDKEITRAYRKMALRYHPDKQRGDAAAKAKNTATFQAISAVHAILSDKGSRGIYDETGSIAAPDELPGDDSGSFEMWVDYFAKIFPKVTQEDIVKFENEYRFSEEERRDVIAAYTMYKGRMQAILDTIMLSTDDDEERFAEMIQNELEENKSLKRYPEWKTYIKQASKPKKADSVAAKKRQAKKEREAKQAAELWKAINDPLPQALVAKRDRDFSSLISSIESKYGDGPKSKRGKPSKPPAFDEPSEEAFLAAQQRIMKQKNKRK